MTFFCSFQILILVWILLTCLTSKYRFWHFLIIIKWILTHFTSWCIFLTNLSQFYVIFDTLIILILFLILYSTHLISQYRFSHFWPFLCPFLYRFFFIWFWQVWPFCLLIAYQSFDILTNLMWFLTFLTLFDVVFDADIFLIPFWSVWIFRWLALIFSYFYSRFWHFVAIFHVFLTLLTFSMLFPTFSFLFFMTFIDLLTFLCARFCILSILMSFLTLTFWFHVWWFWPFWYLI